MHDYLKDLNEKQREAVTTPSQYVRIVAGAGSGKTRVLTTRIVHVIREWGIAPEHILAITFTNKAANEMKVRIENMLGPEGMGAHISTIHSFCVTFLRQEIRREEYPSNFTILDGDDQKSIIKEAMKQLDISIREYPIAATLDFIASCKTAGISPEKSYGFVKSIHGEYKVKMYEFYVNRCHELYGLDFDDLLLWANRILKKYPKVREKWQNKFEFILVDEFQDIDPVQNELINLLTGDNTYLYVVGDPDQTIYSWRGADINIIMGFDKLYPDAQTIILEKNYRSTATILNGANSLIQYNRNRVKKDLYTDNETGSKIIHFTASSPDNEAGYILSRISSLLNSGERLSQIAVLYRSNYLSRPLEKKLIDFKIPYFIYGGVRFYERQEIKDVLSYLRMITAGDDLSFKRIVNVPKRSIGEKTVDRLFELARANGTNLFTAALLYDGPEKTRRKLEEFVAMINDWKQRAADMNLEAIFQMAVEESGYRDMLEKSRDPVDEDRLENVKELLNDVIAFQSSHEEGTLEDYLANVALYTDIQDSSNGESVSLMTIHAAKGLEFDNVFVMGMSEGIFPSMRTIQDSGQAGLEEERRLAYVAFTRARKKLFLSDNNGYSYTTSTSMDTSRFVREIDEQYVQSMGLAAKGVNRTEQLYDQPLEGTDDQPAKTARKAHYRPGDVVVHSAFGEGVVLSVDAGKATVTIAFAYPYKNKTIAMDFPKMHRKGEE
ncbi:MAG: UvrD-helicase domain-containing protein [Erysipelotrichaceae bacterium]|nr:UvrD-helicase domain-containing protein [Erysipelotrichaceae bacterium]